MTLGSGISLGSLVWGRCCSVVTGYMSSVGEVCSLLHTPLCSISLSNFWRVDAFQFSIYDTFNSEDGVYKYVFLFVFSFFGC